MEDPVFLFYRNLHGHPLAGLFWERQFERVLLEHGWEKVPDWECLFVNRDDITMAGKQQNIDPMWKVLVKDVDLGEPTSFLDHDHLGCTQRECETSKNLEDNHRNVFESRISAGASENWLVQGNLAQTSSHAEKCVERYCELVNKTLSNCTMLPLHALVTIYSKKNWDLLENCQKYAHKLSSNARIWHALFDQTLCGQ